MPRDKQALDRLKSIMLFTLINYHLMFQLRLLSFEFFYCAKLFIKVVNVHSYAKRSQPHKTAKTLCNVRVSLKMLIDCCGLFNTFCLFSLTEHESIVYIYFRTNRYIKSLNKNFKIVLKIN